MKAFPLCLSLVFLAGAMGPALADTVALIHADTASGDFQGHWGGFLTSNAFQVKTDNPQFVVPPASLREGDRLLIRPQRLNFNEYLILQRCLDTECTKAEVVRAWNAYGYMGPYPVLTRTVDVKAGGQYILWMQHVPSQGVHSYRLYDRDAPPLVFRPVGKLVEYTEKQLSEAQLQGPEAIKSGHALDSVYVVKFASGSTVRMQALRLPPT
jgi:hypothetical protein